MSQLTLIDEVVVSETPEVRRIQLCSGDLSRLDPEDETDLLVVSAFPGSYAPIPGSLIGALHDAGLSIAQLSQHIAVDLRSSFSCWISQPLENQPRGIQFKRILCFEPFSRGRPEQLVGDIFRSLAPLMGETPPIRSVALPLVAAGYQGADPALMLRLITEAAAHWLSIGLPLSCLRIVINSTDLQSKRSPIVEHERRDGHQRRESISFDTKHLVVQVAQLGSWETDRDTQSENAGWPYQMGNSPRAQEIQNMSRVFRLALKGLGKGAERPAHKFQYDLFVSYAHKDQQETDWLLERLVEEKPELKVFLDRKALTAGSAWQQRIYEALDDCHKVVVLYSPSYLASKVCLEEFNIALCRNRESAERVLLPIWIYTTQLPTYMKLVQFWDCREFDRGKARSVCHELIQEVDRAEPFRKSP